MSPMKILIAGGAGFLGTNLTRRLLKDNHSVVVVDNFITGKRDNLKEIQELYPRQLRIIEQDIAFPLSTIQNKFEVIVNMACPASPPAYQNHPLETLRTNSLGTENLLDLAKRDQARFVHASTSEVYGEPLKHPQKESYWGNVNSYGERSMYDEGKRYAEALIWSYRRLYGLNTGIIRIFNTYGPFMSPTDGRVITNFLHQALKGEDLTVYGDGNQTRSFCYVDDQIEGWVKMINSDFEGPVNIGNPKEFSVLELANLVNTMFDNKLKIAFKPRPADDPTQRQPDITLAKKVLGWEPEVSLEEGINKMLDWLKSAI